MSIHYIYSLLCACDVPCHHTFLEVPVSDTYATDLDLKLTLHVLHFSRKRFIVCCYIIARMSVQMFPFWCTQLIMLLVSCTGCTIFLVSLYCSANYCSVTLLQCHFNAVTLYCSVTSLQWHFIAVSLHCSVTLLQCHFTAVISSRCQFIVS